ncbi:MAG TPA: HEAT repeat domain-containing protein, partial [Myxococcota bacterium]|nr:HEAT repeat domain-containing protein [Myxococcota bacterium]
NVDWFVREAAARALLGVAHEPEVKGALIRCLDNPDVRVGAVEALSRSTGEPDVRKALIERLSDDDPEVRAAAVTALSGLAGEPDVKEALIDLLREQRTWPDLPDAQGTWPDRCEALKVLSKSPPGERAFKALLGALGDLEANVFTAAGHGLARLLAGGASKNRPRPSASASASPTSAI